MKYMIQGLDNSGNWDESVVGNDSDANTFDSYDEAMAAIPELVKSFADDDQPPTLNDFRVVERT